MTVTTSMTARPVTVGRARRRVNDLLDPGSFVERLSGRDQGVVSGHGTVGGQPCAVYATDPDRLGGALGSRGCDRVVDAIDLGAANGWPVIGLLHSGGAQLQEGVASLDGVGRVFAATVRASGRVPQISVVLGPCAGGAAYGPALTDVVVMAPEGRLFVTGPDVVRSVTGEDVDMVRLGGPDTHARRSGVTHVTAASETDAIETARELVLLLADQREVTLDGVEDDPELPLLLPESARRAYDVRPLVARLLDDGTAIELQPSWGPSIVTTLGRLAGRTVGVVANNPARLGGCLDATSAEKAARFVRTCDAFGVPLVVLVDVPGYLPGVEQEWDGVVRRGAKLLHAFAAARVPRYTVVLRKAYGGALIAMNSRSLGATAVYAWPGAELAVMGAEAAVGVLHRRRLAAVDDDGRAELHAALAAEHRSALGGVNTAAGHGVVDAVIDPATTRVVLARELAVAVCRPSGAPNIPL
ncbi:MAG TPA: carboxyl transferase domain-containing protein [Mycobacteriales bacterium]|nr:carboxyl transferase domain-containing protein [Mycobacteriales bacterium]